MTLNSNREKSLKIHETKPKHKISFSRPRMSPHYYISASAAFSLINCNRSLKVKVHFQAFSQQVGITMSQRKPVRGP